MSRRSNGWRLIGWVVVQALLFGLGVGIGGMLVLGWDPLLPTFIAACVYILVMAAAVADQKEKA